MHNRAAIMKDAHRIARDLVKLDRACAPRPYRVHLSIGLSEAWRKAKAATSRPALNPIRVAALNDQIFAEECRPRMNFALVKSLRAELAELQTAA